MASPVQFAGANLRLLPPEGAENVQEMSTFTNGVCVVSCWQLEPDEIAAIVKSGCVWLTVLSGQTAPPVFVGSESAVRGVVVDFGPVWQREAGS